MFGVYLNMKISSQNNNINFTSTPIHKVNLINAKDGSFIPAVFSQLDPDNLLDISAIKQIQKNWRGPSFLVDQFYNDFFHSKNVEKYHAIELLNNDPLEKRIIGLTESRIDHSDYELSLLFVKPELTQKVGKRKIKNIGELLLGEIFNLAKKANASSLEFLSSNTGFYNKTFERALPGLYKPEDNDMVFSFEIKRKTFDKYIDYWKKKFGITI